MSKTKRKVILAVVLWAIAITRMVVYGGNNDTRETLVSAFAEIELNEISAKIQGFGDYGDVYLSESAKENFVKDLGYEIGLNYCEISSERDGMLATTTLTKDGKYADTQIKLITKEEKLTDTILESHQYVSVDIDLGTNIETAMEYQSIIENLFSEMEIDGDVTVELTGYIEGNANMALKNMISDQLLTRLDATVMAENRTDDLYTIYAYTEKIDDYMKISGKKINMNISASYDEVNDKTYFYVSTPITKSDY